MLEWAPIFFSKKVLLLIFFSVSYLILSFDCSPWILGSAWLLLQSHKNNFPITMNKNRGAVETAL